MERRFPKGLAALALSGLFVLGLPALPTADDPPRFSEWSTPVDLGPIVNAWGDMTVAYDACPTISKSGLSLFFRSNRPGGFGGYDIYVSQRDSLESPFEAPMNLGPAINSQYDEFCSTFSPDGHWIVFVSSRPPSAGNCGTGSAWNQDLWISHRKDKRDDFGWQAPVNLGCVVNSPAAENGPAWFEDEATGRTLLYYSSSRPGGAGLLDIYVSEALSDEKGDFGPPAPVAELNTGYADYQPVLRKDGRELFFASNRPGGVGYVDIWTSTRETTTDPWSPPVNLGPQVNSDQSDFHPTLSFDGTMLLFASERGGPGVGWGDVFVTTRTKLRGPNK
jgi:Tol biopolymer transport system component